MNRPPQVLHFNHCFFERTQTFVYAQIMGLNRWKPVLACGEVQNRDQFPTNGLPVLNPYPQGAGLRRLCGDVMRKAGVRDGAFETVLKRVNPRLVHAHFGQNGAYAELACRRANIPLVVSFYGYDSVVPQSDLGRIWVRAYKRLFATARLVLVEGPCIANRLRQEWSCPQAKIRVLRISVPVEEIPVREVVLEKGERVRLLFCGRLIEKKGLGLLLEALHLLRGTNPAYDLRVIGDGALREQLEHQAGTLGLRQSVQFLGAQPRARFWHELAECHLLVAPSATAKDGDTEGGAPTVLLEAQAAGVPIVTTDHADIPFVVVPGGSAFVAREADVRSLARTLGGAVTSHTRWGEMGRTGRRHVLQHHSTPMVCRQLEAIYDGVSA